MKSIANFYKAFAVLLGFAIASQASAGDRPNLLLMGEDADSDTIPRHSQVFTRVLNSLSEQMHNAGFDVYDETAVTLDNFAQGRSRRSDAEMIDIARSVKRPPIDVVVFFSIYASANQKSYTTKVKARVSGRMLNVKTGQRLGNIELDYPGGWNAPVDCNRNCIIDSVGQHSKIIANDIGAVLAKKLGWMVGDSVGGHVNDDTGISAYTLIFDGFTASEMHAMEEYLVVFSGYKSHRVITSTMTRFEYWYQADIKSAKLLRNLNKLLKHVDIEGMVRSSGNTYTVKKIALRGKKSAVDPSDW